MASSLPPQIRTSVPARSGAGSLARSVHAYYFFGNSFSVFVFLYSCIIIIFRIIGVVFAAQVVPLPDFGGFGSNRATQKGGGGGPSGRDTRDRMGDLSAAGGSVLRMCVLCG